MSALGHSRTCGSEIGVSALPFKNGHYCRFSE
jgi:hypothetical protein